MTTIKHYEDGTVVTGVKDANKGDGEVVPESENVTAPE